MTNIAIIGSGPTGIYTLKRLVESDVPLSITVYEASADLGMGTPNHPRANERAMLANIASIELPAVCERFTDWLHRHTPRELEALGVSADNIGEREFYPRIVLGAYFEGQFQSLLAKAVRKCHVVDVRPGHRVTDVKLERSTVLVEATRQDGRSEQTQFDHVVMATATTGPTRPRPSPATSFRRSRLQIWTRSATFWSASLERR